MKPIKDFSKFIEMSENMNYHVSQNISPIDNVFRPESESYFNLLKESRELYNNGQLEDLSDLDKDLLENTDIGLFELYENEMVPLDLPLFSDEYLKILEAEYNGRKVELNRPMRSTGPKKYKVYVKNPKTGQVIVVNFGDIKGGLKAKVADPEARKSFASRHKCHLKKDKTTPGYWACRVNRYAHLWGGVSYPGYW
jgi:hypothetical protein